MVLFQIIGFAVCVFLVIYVLLFIAYKILKPETNPCLAREEMPKLRPLPIRTKNQKHWLLRVMVWIFEIRKWELLEDWHYRLDDDVIIVVPKEFEFDGASIPRPLWALLSPVGLLMVPGLIHDYAYQHDMLLQLDANGDKIPYKEGRGRDYWDELFFKVSIEVNGLPVMSLLAWFALFIGGWVAWNRYRRGQA